MALVYRNGHYYAYRSVRDGRRVRAEYRGAGEVALLIAMDDAEAAARRRAARDAARLRALAEAEARRSDRAAVRELRARLGEADSALAGWDRRAGRLAEAMLRSWGFHRHARGQWRRRRMSDPATVGRPDPRGPMLMKAVQAAAGGPPDRGAARPAGSDPAPARPDPAELAALVAAGDVRTLERLLYHAEAALYLRAEVGTLDRSGIEEVLLQSLGPGFGRVEKEALLAASRLLARDLVPLGAHPAEVLMADRAGVSWLEVRLLELERADLLQQEKPDLRRLEAIDRCLSRAAARLERAVLAVSKVRRLRLPVVVAQQINVSGIFDGRGPAGEAMP